EDGIRDRNVTGVQTCALPISAYKLFHLITTSACLFPASATCSISFSPSSNRKSDSGVESWSINPNALDVPSLPSTSTDCLPCSVLIYMTSSAFIVRLILRCVPVVRLNNCGLVVGPCISILTGVGTSPSLYIFVLLPSVPRVKGSVNGNVKPPV